MRLKLLWVSFLGLLVLSSVIPALAIDSRKIFNIEGEKIQVTYENGYILYNNTKFEVKDGFVILGNKHKIKLEKFPYFIASSKVSREIWQKYLKNGTINAKKLEKLVTLLETTSERKLDTKERESLKQLIIGDLKKEKIRVLFEREFKAKAVPLTSSSENEGIARRLAPNIYQLQYDIIPWTSWPPNYPEPGKNPLIEVFWITYDADMDGEVDTIEYTLAFKDEDYPLNADVDHNYDIYRFGKYGRFVDLEAFYVYIDKTAYGEIYHAWFPSSYSGDQSYFVIKPDHLNGYETYFKTIYVNTWNHLMSAEKDNNPNQLKEIWTLSEYPFTYGDHNAANSKYQGQ